MKGIKGADVMGVVQQSLFNTITQSKIKIIRQIKLLSHSRHLDRKNDVFKQYFPTSYPSDIDDLAMTCSDFVNALKMLICCEKHPVSRVNYDYIKKVAIDRWLTI